MWLISLNITTYFSKYYDFFSKYCDLFLEILWLFSLQQVSDSNSIWNTFSKLYSLSWSHNTCLKLVKISLYNMYYDTGANLDLQLEHLFLIPELLERFNFYTFLLCFFSKLSQHLPSYQYRGICIDRKEYVALYYYTDVPCAPFMLWAPAPPKVSARPWSILSSILHFIR